MEYQQMSNEWYNIPRETKIRAYNQVAEATGVATFAVEKDWWVVQILSAIYEMEVGKFLIFKGGTSLSKAWNIIERFSEDIDLSFDRAYLGCSGDLTRSGVKVLRKRTGNYISKTFTLELGNSLEKRGLSEVILKYIKPEASDADPAQLLIHYPNVVDYPGYIQPRILLEISCSSLKEPNAVQSFNSFLDMHYFESSFAGAPISIPSALPERTFLEKIFLLHEEFQRSHDKIRVSRLSRHLYDVYRLIQSGFALRAIEDRVLYETIVKHRYIYTRIGGIDYNLHQPQTIDPIPILKFVTAWKADYKTMQEQMIYGDSPSFESMIDTIRSFIVNKINRLEWKMEVEFQS